MRIKFNKISVIGLGYIGLPTAALIAARGIEVVGVDVSQEVVNIINEGKIHIVEPELDLIVHAAVTTSMLRAKSVPEPSDAFLIAVPTPLINDHEPDISYIREAAKSIAPVLAAGNLVILESTSPVGTTEKLVEWLAEDRPDLVFPHEGVESPDINIAYCPERVLPGRVIKELVENDRVIGGITRECATRAADLYKSFVEGDCIKTDARTAEMCKLTENAFRDVNIAFANELSFICDRLSIDVWELIRLANRHPRVNILNPGPGVGGHCIAVDPWFIVSSAPQEARVIRTAREVNDAKPDYVVQKVLRAADGKDFTSVACLGLAFKANIDDLRESPAVAVVSRLAGCIEGKLLVVEPHVDTLPAALAGFANIEFSTLEVALDQADIVVLLVDHDHFKEVAPGQIDGKTVIDTRGIWR